MAYSAENKNCQNCHHDFVIEPEDFEFYSQIKVPAPTWCPDCRMIRRMIFRNERTLYKRKCDSCQTNIISMYPAETSFPVYCHDCWRSDKWDPMSFGRDYDFSKTFFQQFKELFNAVPRPALETDWNENSPFTNFTWLSKNAYLSSSAIYTENVFNSAVTWHDTDVFDSYQVLHSNRCHESIFCQNCANVKYIIQAKDCLESSFLFDCRNCQNCFMSSNLRNKSYVFRNQQLTKEEYEKEIAKIDFENRESVAALITEFNAMKKAAIHRFANNINSVNSTGDNLTDCKNAFRCFNGEEVEDVRYGIQVKQIKDCADLYGAGHNGSFLYEGVNVGYNDSHVFFCSHSFENLENVWYSDYCRQSCANLFGCVGLRKKKYCILNKEYDKESFDKLRTRIIAHMDEMPYADAAGRIYKFGEFFPLELSPFAYNETIVQNYFPLTEAEAVAKKYAWRTRAKSEQKIDVAAADFPKNLAEISDDILNKTIECADAGRCSHQCTLAFKITPEELAFHRSIKIALSPLCLNCRFENRLEHRNPIRLWTRQCLCDKNHSHHQSDVCPNKFETPYSPDRPETIYCEGCYQSEIA